MRFVAQEVIKEYPIGREQPSPTQRWLSLAAEFLRHRTLPCPSVTSPMSDLPLSHAL